MKTDYPGRLSQEERWHIWEKSRKKPMGSYAEMRDYAELDKVPW